MFAPNGLNNLLSPMVSEKIIHLLTILRFSRCQDFDPLPCESTFGRLDKQFAAGAARRGHAIPTVFGTLWAMFFACKPDVGMLQNAIAWTCV
jgi:hypothetical protein